MDSKLADQIVKGITGASPILLILAFFTCLIYVGIMQQGYYSGLFEIPLPSMFLFMSIFVPFGIGVARMASLFGSVYLFTKERIWSAAWLLGISLAITWFEHNEAVPMATYYAKSSMESRDGFELLYKASVWFTLPLEIAIAFVAAPSAVKEMINIGKEAPNVDTHNTQSLPSYHENAISPGVPVSSSPNGQMVHPGN